MMKSPDIFTVIRTSPEGDQHIVAMANVTSKASRIEITLSELGVEETRWYDLLGEKEWTAKNARLSVTFQPYDVIWLKPQSEVEKNRNTGVVE